MVFQGTLNASHSGEGVVWEEYEFRCKPGALDRRPCLISPYHYRLDWLMWFAAFQVRAHSLYMCKNKHILKHVLFYFKSLLFSTCSFFSPQTYEQNEWIVQIAGRLLANDSTVLSVMDYNPFQGKDKPL